MAQPLGSPYSYFTNANGDPLSGGKVYTYAAGTTTPQNSYTDSTGVTPAANPVILDSAGKAIIWLQGNYKIAVQDSAGVAVGPNGGITDNIIALGATGNMNSSIYDAANIQEQLVGLTAVQILSNKALVGVNNNSSAAAGQIGEYISSTVLVGAAVSLTNNTPANITSIALIAGDYDVWGTVAFNPAGTTTISALVGSLNTTSATHATAPGSGAYAQLVLPFSTGQLQTMSVGKMRLSLNAGATLYLVATAAFGTSTMGGYGFLGARRIR